MFECPVIKKLSLVQACEWALYGILPSDSGETKHSKEKASLSHEEQMKEIYRASRMFFEGLRQGVFNLYKTNNEIATSVQSLKFNELKGHKGDSLALLIEQKNPKTNLEYYSLLTYIMSTWTGNELYFDTNQVCDEIEPGNFETYKIHRKHKLELENNKIYIYIPNKPKIFLKRLNKGVTRNFLEFLFDHPNTEYSISAITKNINTDNLMRADAIINVLVKELKQALEKEKLSDESKKTAKNALDNFFSYKKSHFKFVPEV